MLQLIYGLVCHRLGFVVGECRLTVQPGRAQALREWPEPRTLDDVVSFRACANYLREFIPRFTELDLRLKVCTKKGAKFPECFLQKIGEN